MSKTQEFPHFPPALAANDPVKAVVDSLRKVAGDLTDQRDDLDLFMSGVLRAVAMEIERERARRG